MRVLVTGANGFIGSNLCRALLAKGYAVAGLVRASSDLSFLTGLDDVDLVTGDINDRAALAAAMQATSVVFHTAGFVADWGCWSEFHSANVAAVHHVMTAARAAGVRRVVHLSSASVYGFPGGVDVTEEHRFTARPGDHYSSSKLAGEQAAMSYHGHGIEVNVIRPATVYGPNDRTTTLKLAAALEQGKFGYVDGGRHLLAPVYIDNLVQLLLLAARSDAAAGEAFNVTDDGYVSWREFIAWMAEDLGCRNPGLSLPRSVVWPLAVVLEAVARTVGMQASPLINKYRIRAVMDDHHYSADKAKRLLGYRPSVDTREGVRRTIDWYRLYRNLCGPRL
ncbi:MAG: NAD-dependent epimerase/dehydratase family protein [Gammaproteobacteria bacterium]|jgi:nucleoside-diphosphate-sugar epimerase|nr:NAD-dependent epimerase/dehydratase family protein [Gammaproteobacteria bacterium]